MNNLIMIWIINYELFKKLNERLNELCLTCVQNKNKIKWTIQLVLISNWYVKSTRIMLDIQTILQKNLQTADVVSDYW